MKERGQERTLRPWPSPYHLPHPPHATPFAASQLFPRPHAHPPVLLVVACHHGTLSYGAHQRHHCNVGDPMRVTDIVRAQVALRM